MSHLFDEAIFLHRIDASRNMARFYALSLSPNLFGETSLFRNWGRIGTRGQTLIETFGSEDKAGDALRKLHARKGRRGYRRPS